MRRVPEQGTSNFPDRLCESNIMRWTPVLAVPAAIVVTVPGKATVYLTTEQAQRLFWLEKNADFSLVLRPSTHAKDTNNVPTTSATLESNGK